MRNSIKHVLLAAYTNSVTWIRSPRVWFVLLIQCIMCYGGLYELGNSLHQFGWKITGIVIEAPGFLPVYSGLTNLAILMAYCTKKKECDLGAIMRSVGLEPNDRRPLRKYSMGMRQRLGIAQAIMDAPDILILDEPFNSLDKDGVKEIAALLLSLKHQGKTMILASHHSDDIDLLCDEVYEMESGKISKQTGGSSK